MAGGSGTRMDMPEEKLLLQYKKPVIFHVIDALKNSHCFSKVVVATSPNSPDTKHVLEQRGIETLTTQGNGYVNDLNFILRKCTGLVFVTSGDLPLLDEKIIQVMIDKFNSENVWTSFIVSKRFLNSLGLEPKIFADDKEKLRKAPNYAYTGISIINADKIKNLEPVKENHLILDDRRVAFNLNTKQDYELLQRL